MKAVEGRNNVKVYNLSAGKSLPDWLTERKRRQLIKRNVDFRRKIELVQDFDMPDISNCIKVTPDGQYVLATGTYKPRVKCFDVGNLSLKFERCFDADAIELCILSDDYSKFAVLQEERYLEFHSKAGRWFRTRIPRLGRDLDCHFPSADLYIAATGSEIYRLNLFQGRFLSPIQTDGPGVNKCRFNQVHYLLNCGMEDGRVEAWDPRSRHRVGVLDCAMHMSMDSVPVNTFSSVKQFGITSLATDGALTLGVGTQSGQILIYDIRSDKPLITKDHMDGFPIKDLEFHTASNKVISMSSKQVKIWDKDDGKPHTSIESPVDYNDLCVIPGSGMIFLATEDTKMQTYFLPSLGPAPKWCSHLDALIEELEEEDMPTQYDDYKFVTKEELTQLGLDNLVGTSVLRAVMHGYFMDVRLYNKAKLIANPFDYEDFKKRKIKQQITEQTQRSIQTKKLPKVNKDLYERLLQDENDKTSKPAVLAAAKKLLTDDRFQGLFKDTEYSIDADSDSFKRLNPVMNRIDKRKQRQMKLDKEEEFDDYDNKKEPELSSDSDSDSDESIVSKEESEEESPIKKRPIKSKNKGAARNKKIKKDEEEEKVDKINHSKNAAPANFVGVDSLADLKANHRKIAKMSLADRLKSEVSDEVNNYAFNNKEISFTLAKPSRNEKIQQRNQAHHLERKALRRSADRIKGKSKDKPY